MFIDAAFVTTMNAQEVANGIHHLLEHASPGTMFLLEISEARNQATRQSYWIQPLPDEPIVTTASGCELVHCITDDGIMIDIIIGKPHLRDTRPAAVVFPSPEAPEHP